MTHAPATSDPAATVKIEGAYAVIRIPLRDVHSLRVALEPCPCTGAKSASTEGIRDRLNVALGRLNVAVRG